MDPEMNLQVLETTAVTKEDLLKTNQQLFQPMCKSAHAVLATESCCTSLLSKPRPQEEDISAFWQRWRNDLPSWLQKQCCTDKYAGTGASGTSSRCAAENFAAVSISHLRTQTSFTF